MEEVTRLYGTPPVLRQRYEELGMWRNQALPEWFTGVSRMYPKKTAIIDGGRAVTFEGLDSQVRAVAGGLQAAGVVPGEIVAYQLPNCLEAVVLHLAAWHAGAIPLPMFIRLKEPELVPRLLSSKAVALVVPVRFRNTEYESQVARLQEQVPTLRIGWAVELPEENQKPERLRKFNYAAKA